MQSNNKSINTTNQSILNQSNEMELLDPFEGFSNLLKPFKKGKSFRTVDILKGNGKIINRAICVANKQCQ